MEKSLAPLLSGQDMNSVEKLNKRLVVMYTVLELLKNAVDFFQNHTAEDVLMVARFRDSLIQRFEYTADIFWKTLKLYLEVKDIATQYSFPGETIRAAVNKKLISEA